MLEIKHVNKIFKAVLCIYNPEVLNFSYCYRHIWKQGVNPNTNRRKPSYCTYAECCSEQITIHVSQL